MSDLEQAQRTFDRANLLSKLGLIVFVIYLAILQTFATVNTYRITTTIAKNQRTNTQASEDRFERCQRLNEAQHSKTQEYVACIATVLLQPIEERTPDIFTTCRESQQ
jgi:hypothetical protein